MSYPTSIRNAVRVDAQSPIVQEINRRRKSLGVKKVRASPTVKWLPPIPVERSYQRELLKHVSNMADLTETIVVAHLPSLVEQADNELLRSDGFGDAARRLISALSAGIASLKFPKKRVAEQVAIETNVWNETQWEKVQKNALGVAFFQSQPWLGPLTESFIQENVTLITKMETDYLASVEGIVQRGLRTGQRHETIAKNIESQIGISRNRAKLIGRDQVSKFNGQLSERRQVSIGVTHYVWRTAQDERVRPSHDAHKNKRFAWNEAPVNTGHPGQDIQCRCIAEPDFTPVLEEL